MINCKQISIIVCILLSIVDASAQRKKKKSEVEQAPKQELIYDNITYIESIKSIQLYPGGKENDFPIYTLGSNDALILSFDDLRPEIRSFYFSIEHCNADWKPSRASVLDYAIGYNEDRIVNIASSQGTLQGYTNYNTTFPNEYVGPKIAGNYLLKVYEDADKERLIITRKFYVVRPLMTIEAQVVSSNFADKRLSNQKINLNIKTGLSINNPYRDLQVQVLQNQRTDNMMTLKAPMFVGPNEVKYNSNETLDFLANNEFRYADLRSIKGSSGQIKQIEQDSSIEVSLFDDEDKSNQAYATLYDENGKFYIRNLDYDNADISSDYLNVLFSLNADKDIEGDIYIVGKFNEYIQTAANKLKFNPNTKKWEVKLKLKQGLYDYEYVLVDKLGKAYSSAFSGSFYATGNDYHVLVYYRRQGTYWDELLGVETLSINNKVNKNKS